MTDIFDNEDKIKEGISNFKTLKEHPGWKTLKLIVDTNIDILKRQILSGEEAGVRFTEEDMNRKRDKLRAYEEVIGTPDYWINRLETEKEEQVNDDPYHTAESLIKERMKNN